MPWTAATAWRLRFLTIRAPKRAKRVGGVANVEVSKNSNCAARAASAPAQSLHTHSHARMRVRHSIGLHVSRPDARVPSWFPQHPCVGRFMISFSTLSRAAKRRVNPPSSCQRRGRRARAGTLRTRLKTLPTWRTCYAHAHLLMCTFHALARTPCLHTGHRGTRAHAHARELHQACAYAKTHVQARAGVASSEPGRRPRRVGEIASNRHRQGGEGTRMSGPHSLGRARSNLVESAVSP